MTDDAALRRVAVLEASTLLALVCVAVPLKHLAHLPLAVTVMGPAHGIVFLAYCWTVVETGAARSRPRSETCKLLAAALVPFGGFVAAARLARRPAERLARP